MSIGHALVRHLFHLNGQNEDVVLAPYGASQPGIAEALGITRAHASLELARLMGKGLVARSLRHVRLNGGRETLPTRRRTYALTEKGMASLVGVETEQGEACRHLEEAVLAS